MKKTLTALMVLAFGLGASTSFAQNAETPRMTAPASHSMKMEAPQAHQAMRMDAPQAHQTAPAPQAKHMPPAPHHKQAKKKHRTPKHRMHAPM